MNLENLAFNVPNVETEVKVYQLMPLEYMSAVPLYGSGDIVPSGNKLIIPLGNLGIDGLKDLHDTYKVDRFGNLYGGHTTFNSDYHINVDSLKAQKDIILDKW